MAGIYVHIPFCKQACYYCDFHFSTYHQLIDPMVESLVRELELQKDYLHPEEIETIYFGGGTPSVLSIDHLSSVLECIHDHYGVIPDPEITLEANPDDLNPEKLKELKNIGINRLSIGVQTFDDRILKFLNRAHDRHEAIKVIELARSTGFSNINLDLIYAISEDDDNRLGKDIQELLRLKPEHISAYSLTIEPGTVFGSWLKKRKISAVKDDRAAKEFEMIDEELGKAGYLHYETSNYALPGHFSRHNLNYWNYANYLGVGPSAHSFNGQVRQFNIKNNARYIRALQSGHIPSETERLSINDHVNERIMLGLRTHLGCDMGLIHRVYGVDLYEIHRSYIRRLIKQGMARLEDHRLILNKRGWLLADQIAEDLFLIDLE